MIHRWYPMFIGVFFTALGVVLVWLNVREHDGFFLGFLLVFNVAQIFGGVYVVWTGFKIRRIEGLEK